MSKTTREIALDVLFEVEKKNIFLSQVLPAALRANQFMSKHDRAFISRLAEGVTEQKIRLDYILDIFSKTKMKKCRPQIRCILRMAAYEIFYMDGVPDEATCNEYVNLTAKRGFKNLKGYVNGVLRSVCRNKDDIAYPTREQDEIKYLSVKYSVPEKLVNLLLKDYQTSDIETFFDAGGEENKITIRANTNLISVTELKNKLIENGIKVENGKYNSTSLIISGYDYIRNVWGFHEGYFTVQDESSSLEVLAAGIKQGDLIVDVCAAPGGKTLYAAELTGPTGRVIARDISEDKVDLIEENLERLQISNVTCSVKNALDFDCELKECADVVIADLPCTGLGVMNRKNDIKYHVNEATARELSLLQRSILDTVSAYVKPGGVLIYSTCSICSMENEDNVFWFLENHKEFYLDDIRDYVSDALKERAEKGYFTLLQGFDDCDGFFISRFKRKK